MKRADVKVTRLSRLEAVVGDRVRTGDVAMVAGAMRSSYPRVAAEQVAGAVRAAFPPGAGGPNPPMRSEETWRTPEQTIAGGQPDAGDLAIVAVSLLMAVGVQDAWIIVGIVDRNGEQAEHAWVEGSDTLGSYFLDPATGRVFRPRRPVEYFPKYAVHPTRGGVCLA